MNPNHGHPPEWPLPSLLALPAIKAAPLLLGQHLVRLTEDGEIRCPIVEAKPLIWTGNRVQHDISKASLSFWATNRGGLFMQPFYSPLRPLSHSISHYFDGKVNYRHFKEKEVMS